MDTAPPSDTDRALHQIAARCTDDELEKIARYCTIELRGRRKAGWRPVVVRDEDFPNGERVGG